MYYTEDAPIIPNYLNWILNSLVVEKKTKGEEKENVWTLKQSFLYKHYNFFVGCVCLLLQYNTIII